MNTKKTNTDQRIEYTLDSVSSIDTVKTPPFFKEKVLNRIAQEAVKKESGVSYLDGFTPKYQAAALICFIILNAFALFSYNTDNDYGENVENFAEVYGLSETDTDSYLYQK
ncbi:hypothetical protein [uncultured Croceitalea sp.]|uniref:hypothetical protein n=1 Tax=uncultured Croceitalea sp. TaxID=1798908 RepID=UPI003305EC94